jgi:hypothetical protein
MLRGTLVTGVRRLYSRVVASVRLHKELKASYRQDKAEPAQRQSYVDGVSLEWLVCLLAVARFMQRRDCIEEGILLRLRLPLT